MTDTASQAERVAAGCPYNPWQLADMSLGAHRCPVCGCVVIAGFPHGPCTDIGCPHTDKGESGRLMQEIVSLVEAEGGNLSDEDRAQLVGVRRPVADPSHPLVSCLRQIEWRLNRDGWTPDGVTYFPSLHTLYRVGHRLASRDIRVPEILWKEHGSASAALAALLRICEAETETFRRLLSPKCVGLAFASEAWSTDRALPAREDSVSGCTEVRDVYGVLVDGSVGQVCRQRGGPVVTYDAASGAALQKIIALGEWLRKVQDA